MALVDTYQRPEKQLEEFTPAELRSEGEVIASLYLRHRGYTILTSDDPAADIVALDESIGDPEVVLVDVKTTYDPEFTDFDRPDDAMLYPDLSVDENKQRVYQSKAMDYLKRNPYVSKIRYDVVAVSIVADRKARLRHLANAYWFDEEN